MGRRALVISQMHVRSALQNPVSWIAISAAVFKTIFVSDEWPFHLAEAGIELSLVETVLHVFFSSYHYTTWGLFLPFLFIVSPMLYATEHERLVATRAGDRSALWAAKLIAVVHLSVLFVATVVVVSLVLIAPNRELSLFDWSSGYVEVTRQVLSAPEGSLDPNYYLVANEYLVQAKRPVSAAALQAGLLVLALTVVGSLCAVLSQHIERQAFTLIAVAGYWLLFLIPPGSAAVALWFVSPQAHIVLGLRSAQFPYWVSFLYLLGSLVFLNAAGWYSQRKAALG